MKTKTRRRIHGQYWLPERRDVDYEVRVSSDADINAYGFDFDAREPALSNGNLSNAGERAVGLLAQKAKAGDAEAAHGLVQLAIQATEELTRIAENNPELLRGQAGSRRSWPVMKPKHERQSKAEKELFSKIRLGADAPIELDPAAAKWKMDSAGEIAYSLLQYLEVVRLHVKTPPRRRVFDYGRIETAAESLRPFRYETASEWWNAARAALLSSYPAPEKVKELDALVTAPSKRRSPGRIRQAILDTLKARFESFAPNPY